MNQTQKDTIKLVLENDDFSKEMKKIIIESIYELERDELDADLREYLFKQYAGATLQFGSTLIPFSSLGKAGALVGEQLLKKSIGRKLSQEIGSGAATGMGSGAVFGAGRGMSENKNPIVTALTDAITGLVSGGALGAIGGNIQKILNGVPVRHTDVRDLSGAQFKNYKKVGQNYYKNYNQDRIVYNKDLGAISISAKGMNETISKNPQLINTFPNLSEALSKGKYIGTQPLYKKRKDDSVKFHAIEYDNIRYLIAEDSNGIKKFYLAKNNIVNQGTPPRAGGASINDTETTNPAFPNDDRVHKLASNNIIPNNSGNVNTAETNLNNNSVSNIVQSFLAAAISKNVYDKNHIFTPEEIGAMSREEFEENESAIMEQMAKGQIRSAAPDYSNFKNPHNGDDRIYSREDIQAMSTKEFEENEQAIYAQMKTIGVPYNSELAENAKRNGVVYVRAYTRDDGTEVKGYYRSLPRI